MSSITTKTGRRTAAIAALVATALITTACSSPDETTGSTTADTIKVGMVTSLTGDSSADFAASAAGAQARIDLQNEQGGVNGRKLELVTADDQSTANGVVTAVNQLVQRDKVLGVISMSTLLFSAAPALQKAGVPVTGAGFDGPEWGQKPNTNMFSLDPIDPDYPPTTIWAEFFKSIGATRIAGIGFADIPSSSGSINQIQKGVKAAGLTAAYTNVSIPYGTTDFTATVLQMKEAKVDGYVCSCDTKTELALATAVKQAGLSAKGILSSGYAQATLDDAASKATADGMYAYSYYVPYELKTAGTEAMLAALAKSDKDFKAGTIPSYGLSSGYLAADLMIAGLEKAGTDPTGESLISGLRTVTSYDADGVLPAPISFAADQFGKSLSAPCNYFVQLKGDAFVAQPKICGTLVGS
ncbi:ABC transporter substrate-binding protein [Actinoplanes sp. NPDC026619]|uniref:ABC transporter substrate-binding protein n=1 Tax=Actinoplanes sp. NPDC026619 TaxID=3155798 RepID=UPI003403DE9A